MMGAIFRRGDIVDFDWADDAESRKTQNIRNALQTAKPYKLIILRPIDDKNYLVVVCKAEEKKTQMKIDTDAGPLYVKLLSFYPIDSDCLRHCSDINFKENSIQIVEKIYTSHNSLIEKNKKARLEKVKATRKIEEEKRAKKRQERAAQHELEKRYTGPYEMAVMNNDTKAMREIERIVGYAPGQKGSSRGYSKRNGKVLYSNFNPRPCSGGRFTPK